ncbi:CDP-glycerol glycerophosphotransferase family protein [Planococcus glaciei]|uniref:CDP-glycerol glycerophosphotransferase family protein n=1 Tax=Planococcus glaciei TaxID=459472 RepID=UPI001C734662|nr:CDP-glycerol glycerophosphotransferase family protein [Planococcus glaciei]MBX0313379.1 CDP-glycerol glycerophosphotransferase family protein [Planococcus glaciei]
MNGLKKSVLFLKVFRIIFIIMGLLPRKKKLVIFESFHARQYSDNPRAIFEYMKMHYPDYELLWSVDRRAIKLFQKLHIPYIQRFTLRWFLVYPRAAYWINNVRLPGWMPKPAGTVYVQTWHGTPLKKLGLDIEEVHMPGTETDNYKKNFLRESAKWNYLVSPNAYSTSIFKRAFGYQGEIIESGYPRNDVLANPSITRIRMLKRELGIPEDKKLMLYAPTWRDNEYYEKGKYKFSFQFDLKKWGERYGDEWVLLSRMHYLVAESFDFSRHDGVVLNVSDYPDIRDLYLISDLLITDYSSVFFDYAILERPIIFFMYDLAYYRNQLRGFYFDIEEKAPGPIVRTETELFQAIDERIHFYMTPYSMLTRFKQEFCSLEDGRATERVVKTFLRDK